ncbi:hypothetical protein J3R83DRAFT_14008 [Lanmaoa asiatica]|nr:hypothetical protein J3R83DRAFT_14008 [Lanmaoa asiatica]
MEEDEATPSSLPPWVELEYTHMKMLAGASARVLFTHLSQRSCASLQEKLASCGPAASSQAYTQSILELLKNQDVPLSKGILGIYSASSSLKRDSFSPGKSSGDDPPRDRTSQLRQLGFPTRHLGAVQMTTDTALGVTKRVVDDKIPLDKIPYVEFPTIKFNAKESVEMPFKYIADRPGGEPLLPSGMKELLYEDLNKGFDL